MAKTMIEWSGFVWNPMLGCTKCSPGCKNCYAISEVGRERSESHKGLAVLQPVPNWRGNIRFLPERLPIPLKYTVSTKYFVNSLSDVFHEDAALEWQKAILEVMRLADWHIFQILTKRDRRLRSLMSDDLREYADLPNVWWGVSVEDRKHGLPRLDELRESPVRLKWLSIEPLLEDLGEIDLEGIDWVVVGGESGRRARPVKEEWVLSIREQCKAAGVKFFFKQWGNWRPRTPRTPEGRTHQWPDGTQSVYMAKKMAGRRIKGRTYNASPRVHVEKCPDRQAREKRKDIIRNIASTISHRETPAKSDVG